LNLTYTAMYKFTNYSGVIPRNLPSGNWNEKSKERGSREGNNCPILHVFVEKTATQIWKRCELFWRRSDQTHTTRAWQVVGTYALVWMIEWYRCVVVINCRELCSVQRPDYMVACTSVRPFDRLSLSFCPRLPVWQSLDQIIWLRHAMNSSIDGVSNSISERVFSPNMNIIKERERGKEK